MKKNNFLRRVALTLVFALVITSLSGIEARAAVTYSESYEYQNPLGSGVASYTYTDGKVTFTNSKVTDKVMCIKDIASVNDEEETGQAFDENGTIWIDYRNQKLYWYNYEILGKFGVPLQWKGEQNNIEYEAVSLKKLNPANVNVATHYVNSALQLIKLPDWKTLYRIAKGEDFVTPTPVPTQEPTAVPTATPSNNNCGCKDGGKCTCPAGQCKCDNCNCGPTASCQSTQVPTVAPTTVPTQMPTAVPSQTPSNNCGCKDGGKCTCPAGQCKCDNCNCGPTVSCHPTQKPTVAPTKKPGNNANNSEINVPGNNNTINVNQNISITDTTTNVIGDGNNVGVDVNGGKAAANSTKKKKTTTKVSAKKHARVVTSGKRIKLYTKKNKLHGWLIFNKKTGSLNWNGYHMKGVKTCGFIQKSWNVIVVMKNGTVYKLPKTVKTGKTVHKTRIKCSEAKTLNRDSYGFVKYVKLKCGGVKNVSGK